MSAVWLVVRRSLRQHWVSGLVLVLLVGATGGVVMGSVAGARRTDSAYARLLDELAVATLSLEAPPEYFDAIAALPQVEAAAPQVYFFVGTTESEIGSAITIAGVDDRFNSAIDRAIVTAGRLPDPARVDEVFLNTDAAEAWDVGVGRELTFLSMTPEQVERLIFEGVSSGPEGPTVTAVVVGIGRTEVEVAVQREDRRLHPSLRGRPPHRHRQLRPADVGAAEKWPKRRGGVPA